MEKNITKQIQKEESGGYMEEVQQRINGPINISL